MDLEKIAEIALQAAIQGAKVVKEGSIESLNIDHKSTFDLVTQIDKESEKRITEHISNAFPYHTIYAEESGLHKGSNSEFEWFIDPLDGTTNYVHNYPSYAVSIGVHYKGDPIAGVVYDCYHDHIYSATKGNGAFRNEVRLEVSKTRELAKSLLVTGFDYEHGDCWNMNMKLHRSFTDKTQGVRRLGAAAIDLCHVATGQVDGYWEFNLNPWDSSAGILIISEAGGNYSQLNGKHYTVFNNNIVAGNPLIHKEMLRELSQFDLDSVIK